MPNLMKLVIVDDSKLFQDSLIRSLSTVAGIEIVGCAEQSGGACRLIDTVRPGIVVLDVELQGGSHGIDVLRYVTREHPATKVVVLSNLNWPALRRTYFEAGAAAYFDKSMEFDRARLWIAACAQGRAGPWSGAPPDSA